MSVKEIHINYESEFLPNLSMLIDKIRDSQFNPDSMIVITRGGLVVAGYLSQALNIKLIDTFCVESYDCDDNKKEISVLKECNYDLFKSKRVLVVDDLQDSGETIFYIQSRLLSLDIKFKTAILYHKDVKDNLADFCVWSKIKPDWWIVFPWEERLDMIERKDNGEIFYS